jgi:long-subunit fatty acid transport protein
LLDYFAENANANKWSEFYEDLAWDADLLVVDDDDIYYHDIEEAGYGQSLRKSISKEGAVNEYSLALGINFNHRLYMGASIGIVDVFYRESSELHEWDKNNNIDYFNSMTFNSLLHTTGTGYNGKIGLIFKPFNALRLGASVHSPTFYNLNDVFTTSLASWMTYDDGDEDYDIDSPVSEYDYDLESPLRATLSGAFVIGKAGLISVDYEYVDYGTTKLRRGGDGYQFINENEDIAEIFKPVGNIRIGGEFIALNNVSLRAGYEYYPSPYNDEAFGAIQPNASADKITYSGGLGIKTGGFFFDVAYRYSHLKDFDHLYPAPGGDYYAQPEMAAFVNTKHKLLFTLGFKF